MAGRFDDKYVFTYKKVQDNLTPCLIKITLIISIS